MALPRSDRPDPTSARVDIVLADPDGAPVRWGDLAAEPLVVVLVRYYGCLPCQEYVMELSAATRDLPDGARVVAVGGSADFQARWLRDEKDVAMELLLDPDQRVRRVAELGNMGPLSFLSIKGGASYVGALRRGLRPQKITRDTVRSPGVAVFGPDLEVRWTYEGTRLGDYPPVADVLAGIRSGTWS